MQPATNVYKWATWILVIVVIVLAVMLTKSNSETITDTIDDASMDIQDCSAKLSAWEAAHPAGSVVSAEAQAELDGLRADCVGVLEDVQDEI